LLLVPAQDEALARSLSEKAESQAARRNAALARQRREAAARKGGEKRHREAAEAARARMLKAEVSETGCCHVLSCLNLRMTIDHRISRYVIIWHHLLHSQSYNSEG
jgi:hypothetical protein